MTAALAVTTDEKWMLRRALLGRRDISAQQRAMSERDLAEGCNDVEVVTRLAYHEELDLVTIDGLLTKLRAL